MTEANSRPPAPPAWPVLGHAVPFVRDPFGFVRRSVASTGDVFRMRLVGKDVYVVAHPDHVETALLDRDAFAKLDDFRVAFGDALLAAEGEQWQRQRHAMEGFFGPARVRDHADEMAAVAGSRLDDWTAGSTVRVDEEMRTVALQNLFEVVLGQSVAGDEAEELAEAAHALNRWFEPSSWALPEWVPTPARREFRRGAADLRERAAALLAASGDDPDGESLLATLASLRDDPDSAFDRAEVLDQVVGMLFAGHETTALAMTYAMHLLGSHPDVADRFHAELDAVLDGRPSTGELQDLPYLEQVVDEALRLYPPVHAIPRVTTERVRLGEHAIPAGSQVLLSVWSLHRDPRFYDAPETFDPGRWADSTPRERGYAFVPFGAGPRICIGRHFARLEMKAVLASVGRRFRLESVGDLSVTPQMTTQPADGVTVRVRERE